MCYIIFHFLYEIYQISNEVSIGVSIMHTIA